MPAPRTYIKNIAFQIRQSYQLDNSPLAIDENDQKAASFVGRERQQTKFLKFLQGSKKGVFLVTGYRGMGKTSFVNYVINQYAEKNSDGSKRGKRKKNRIIPIHLTLAQNKPKELDILKLLVSSIYDKYRDYRHKKSFLTKIFNIDAESKYFSWKLLGFAPLFLLSIFIAEKAKVCSDCSFNLPGWLLYIKDQSVLIVFIYLGVLSILGIISLFLQRNKSPGNRISGLMERCYAALSEENNSGEEIVIPKLNSKLSNSRKRTRQYPIAEAKQIEYELKEFLAQAASKKRGGLEFIIIFDELDKVEPVFSTPTLHNDLDPLGKQRFDNSYELDMRERKQAIINIIASLKNFFTMANARFVFIAGREMFDASLADIADRQSSISSIFTYIFNIESLLKEIHLKDLAGNSNTNNASLSNAIEAFLIRILFSPEQLQIFKAKYEIVGNEISLYKIAQDVFLDNNLSLTDPEIDMDQGKIYFTLQNFVTYLTYRSNGSPQKLIKAIHEFIIVKKNFESENCKNLVYKQYDDRYSTSLYLYFNYYNQYRIGFISYLYRPFLIKHGRKFKLFSDNIIVSTSYLFDHLLKFHPFAFSLTNLEMIPEVLSPNKTPYLREHLRQIIDHLGATHIRESELSLFDFKFYSRTLNEISFLSKIFETEAAAFNFTLDESFLIKIHVRNKIKELRNIYAEYTGKDDINPQIFSIAHLNEILGDLDFFDQEFDDAINSYSDAIKPLANFDPGKGELNLQDFITLIKNKLKLGLCFEKISSYEQALAMYSDCCQDAKKFMSFRLMNGQPVNTPYPIPLGTKKTFDKVVFYSSSLSDVLQIVLQGFLSKIFIQEKMGIEGITDLKLTIALGGFLKIAGGFVDAEHRNHVLKANAFLFAAKLLYFKNSRLGFDVDENLNNSELILPPKFYHQIRGLMQGTTYLFPDDDPEYKHKKMPAAALSLYIIGMYEILSVPAATADSNFVNCVGSYTNIKTPKVNNVVKILLRDLKKVLLNEDESFGGVHFRYISTLLSNIGDCLLSMYSAKPEEFNTHKFSEIFDMEKMGSNKLASFDSYLKTSTDGRIQIADILMCYYLSGEFIYKYGRKMSRSFQHNKILYVLRVVLTKDVSSSNFLEMIRRTLVIPVLRVASETSGHSDIHMLEKAKEQRTETKAFALNNVSYHPESRETVLLYYYIEIKLGVPAQDINTLISPYNTFGTQYSRIMELDFYAKYLDEYRLKSLLESKENYSPDHDDTIIDFLFTRFTMLRILEIYGSDYSLGFRFLAYTHYKVAQFLKKCKELDISILNNNNIINKLNVYLGEGSYASLDFIYHFQIAKGLYEKAIQLHTGGKEYKKMLNEMIYLEDDFNDNGYHFGAALDKYLLVNNVLEHRVKECDEIINDSGRYNPQEYLESEWPPC